MNKTIRFNHLTSCQQSDKISLKNCFFNNLSASNAKQYSINNHWLEEKKDAYLVMYVFNEEARAARKKRYYSVNGSSIDFSLQTLTLNIWYIKHEMM